MPKAELNRRKFLKRGLHLGTGFFIASQFFAESAEAKPIFKFPPKIIFLGDSITMAGGYINIFEFYIRLRYPNWQGEVLNMGLSSETASGLSEPAHPFPRPYIHNRLRNVLRITKPDLVFVCYGMNCGIYHPFAKERFDAYKAGMLGLINQVEATGAKLVLCTPPPFAHQGSPKTILDANEDYSYAKPFEAYDQVLKGYGTWLQSQFKGVYPVVDLHAALSPYKDLCYGKDIIHPNEYGHFIMAHAILNELQINKVKKVKIKAKEARKSGRENIDFDFAQISPQLIFERPVEALQAEVADLNAVELKLKGIKFKEVYELDLAPDVKIRNTGKAWRKGVSLATELANLQTPTAQSISQLWKAIENKRAEYDRALLNEIGHGRPGVESVPFAEALEVKKNFDEQMKRLSLSNSINAVVERIS